MLNVEQSKARMPEGPLFSFIYTKSGDAVFFSHLDTIRILERALRRTGLPLCFTQGCNPHIRLSSFRAVPVGVETDGEWISVKLADEVNPGELCSSLNAQLPGGFTITKAVRGGPEGLDAEEIGLTLCFDGPAEDVESAAGRWIAMEKIETTVTRKDRCFTVDVRPLIRRYEMRDGFVLFELEGMGGRQPRIGDLARALYKLASQEHVMVKALRIIHSPVIHGNPQSGLESNR